MAVKNFSLQKKIILISLFSLLVINWVIPFLFIRSPLGLGLEADALDYRIPLLELMLKTKHFPNLAWTYVDDFPSLSELVMISISFVGRFFHFSADSLFRLFPILSYIYFSVICYWIGRLFLSKIWALFGVLQIITASAVVAQDNAVMIDLFNGSLLATAVYFFLKRILEIEKKSDQKQIQNTALCGLFLGLSFATRYTLLPSIAFLSVVFLVVLLRLKSRKKELFLFSLFLILPIAPFLIRNFFVNENPIYPLFNPILHGINLTTRRYREIFGMVESFGYGRTFKDFILLPIRFAFDKNGFDYSVGPLLLMYLPVYFILFFDVKKKERKSFTLLFLLFILLIFAWFISSRHARFLYHCYPLFVFSGLVGIHQLFKRLPKNSKIPILFSLFFTLMAVAGTFKHLKKHDEERSGVAFAGIEKHIPLWANSHLQAGKKVIFLTRTQNVYLFKNDFIFAYPHVYANSLLDYREFTTIKDYLIQLKNSGAWYIYSFGEDEFKKELMKKFTKDEIDSHLALKRAYTFDGNRYLMEIQYR